MYNRLSSVLGQDKTRFIFPVPWFLIKDFLQKKRNDRGNYVTSPNKMAAAMDVDTPSGTNSGASKKRFEVKKVRLFGGEACVR